MGAVVKSQSVLVREPGADEVDAASKRIAPMLEMPQRLSAQSEPRGELTYRTLAMPADTNPSGTMFGGWIMSIMDAAGAVAATKLAQGTVVTVAVSNMALLKPLRAGDVICCYTDPGARRQQLDHLGRRGVGFAPGPRRAREGDRSRVQVCSGGPKGSPAAFAGGSPMTVPHLEATTTGS